MLVRVTPNQPWGGSHILSVTVPPPPGVCPGDVNSDGVRNTLDLGLFLLVFGAAVPAGAAGALDADGLINVADLALLLSVFGTGC